MKYVLQGTVVITLMPFSHSEAERIDREGLTREDRIRIRETLAGKSDDEEDNRNFEDKLEANVMESTEFPEHFGPDFAANLPDTDYVKHVMAAFGQHEPPLCFDFGDNSTGTGTLCVRVGQTLKSRRKHVI